MSDPLDPAALVPSVVSYLPSAARTLDTQYDAFAALLHTVMIRLGFRLVALDDSTPALEIANGVLPESWRKNGPDSYAFRYKHDQSSLVFFLKIVKLGNRTVIHGIALESGTTKTLDILTSDYVSPSFFPFNPNAAGLNPLINGFISSTRVNDLISLYKINILQKLVPGLRKEGYEESVEAIVLENRGSASNNQPRGEPLLPRSDNRRPSRDYDPLRIPSVGRRDLDPLGGNPFSPPSLFGGGDEDGMFVGPNHPIFRGPGGIGRVGPARTGPWGGDGFLPPMGAPPGARFDPIGPGPRSSPTRGFGGTSQGRFSAPFSGDPDNDEFMPPGADDMFS
jgi:hypothetical protein